MDEAKINRTDISLALLRSLMCFGVILAHCWKSKTYTSIIFLPFKEIETLAAPVFMILTFYFSASLYFSPDISNLKKRMTRLLIPHLGWALIYFAVLQFFEAIPFTELLWQIFMGHSYVLNATMWFQTVLIVLTLLFFMIFSHADKKEGMFISLLLTLFALFMQISETNYNLFYDLRFELKYPLGRIIEMIPYAFTGLLLNYYDAFTCLKKYRYIFMMFFLFLLSLPYITDFPVCNGFGYAGITCYYLSLFMTLFCGLLPFDLLYLTPKKFFYQLSRYTLGIYCIHRLVFVFLGRYSFFSTFTGCIILYFICYLICFLINQIPDKIINSLVN